MQRVVRQLPPYSPPSPSLASGQARGALPTAIGLPPPFPQDRQEHVLLDQDKWLSWGWLHWGTLGDHVPHGSAVHGPAKDPNRNPSVCPATRGERG